MPDDVEARLGVRELVVAVRRHGAAGVQVGVDQRRERARRLDAVVELEAQLAQQRQVGPEAGGDDHLVGTSRRVAVVADQRPSRPDARVVEAGDELDRAVVDEAADRRAERAARGQPVVAAAAEVQSAARAADRPDDPVPGRFAQRDEVEHGVDGRVAAAGHQHALARVARAVARRARRGCRRRSGRRARARPRPGRPPAPSGFGRVHVPEASITARASSAARRRRASTTTERRVGAAGVLDLVDAGRVTPTTRARAQAPAIPGARPAARGSARRARRRSGGRRPAAPASPWPRGARRRRVGVEPPGREQADVAPLADAAPTASPASRTSGSRPRASRWAAAARPTGPAPMTATGSWGRGDHGRPREDIECSRCRERSRAPISRFFDIVVWRDRTSRWSVLCSARPARSSPSQARPRSSSASSRRSPIATGSRSSTAFCPSAAKRSACATSRLCSTLKQSTVSYHLKQLLDAGIVAREKRGSYAYYTLKSRRHRAHPRAARLHRLRLTRVAAPAVSGARLVVRDAAAPVELDVTAVEQQLAQLPAGALHREPSCPTSSGRAVRPRRPG